MAYVLTVGQIASRRGPDLVKPTMATLTERLPGVSATRTVGDEFQLLVTAEPLSVVTAILLLMREGGWHVGVGIGAVEVPTPADLREARGPAFVAARQAVAEAKGRADRLRVVAPSPAAPEAEEAEVVLDLLLALRARRSPAGWAAADLAEDGLTQADVGERLGVSRQAVQQRLTAARWSMDVAARPVAARLLERADAVACGTGSAGVAVVTAAGASVLVRSAPPLPPALLRRAVLPRPAASTRPDRLLALRPTGERSAQTVRGR